MAVYPALEVIGVADADLVLAAVDDYAPVAATPAENGLTVFFASAAGRAAAAAAVRRAWPTATVVPRDVDDEDWARRSQESLGPIVVGRVTVRPASVVAGDGPPAAAVHPADRPVEVVITPSMGFGTGHHATTRLCLAALQQIELRGRRVLDVGTGSGVLALAAVALGASSATGVDYDPDAVASARENLPLNPGISRVDFTVHDLTADPLPQADVVTANLTGALLCRQAATLIGTVAPGGALVISGLLASEERDVRAAFAALAPVWDGREDEWVAICFRRAFRATV